MSIRVRLLLSYLAMLLIPLFLLFVGVVFVIVAFFGDLRGLYRFDFGQQNPLTTFIQQQEKVFTEIKQLASQAPDSLINDTNRLSNWNRKLIEINMGMVIEKNEAIVYSSPSIDQKAFLAAVKSVEKRSSSESQLTRNFIEHFFVSSHYDFKYADGASGSVYIVTDINPLGEFVGKYLLILVFSLLLILVVTNGLLTFFVSRSIVKPLKALKLAAEQIKEGNLDYVVKSKSKDEIGELFGAFEQMRGKLKHSVERQLQDEANRKELISNISHDLKTPVTSIKGYVEGILDGVADSPDKLDKYIKTIYAKATDMDRLIDELFLFSKLDLHNVPYQYEKVDLIGFLQDCTEELQFDLNEKGIVLTLELPKAGAFQVGVDREKLKRVVLNILENAEKYMDQPQGLITIRLTEQDEWVMVQIQDNGQGIPAEALPHIFERFYRADLSRNSKTGGSGLGLAIVKQIIEGHGGEIRAASEVGVGTSIFFTIKKLEDKKGLT